MLSYIFIAVCIFLISIFLLGRFNHRLHIYDEDGRAAMVFLAGMASVVWPFSLTICVLIVSICLIVVGGTEVLKAGERK